MKVAMNNPKLYNKSNEVQRKTAYQCLTEYANKIKWNKMGDTAIDIGCGDGSVTRIVKNFGPYSYKKFVGSDINEEMIKFATREYGHEDIAFRVLDIEGDLPEDFVGAFNHVFSFYALHWVKNQEKAFRNVHKLLTDDGDCLLVFIGSTAIYSIYNILANHPKWKTWLKDVGLFVSPYHDIKNPEKLVSDIAEKCGFHNIDVKHKPLKYVLDDADALKNMVQSVEPFSMPQEVFDDFIKDYMEVGISRGLVHFDKKEDGKTTSVSYDYSLIIVNASK